MLYRTFNENIQKKESLFSITTSSHGQDYGGPEETPQIYDYGKFTVFAPKQVLQVFTVVYQVNICSSGQNRVLTVILT